MNCQFSCPAKEANFQRARPGFFFGPVLLMLLLNMEALHAAETNGTAGLPASSLLPPRGEIPPTLWEQYGGWIVAGAVILIAIVALLVWFLARPKPRAPIPVTVQARKELETLRREREDPLLLSRTSQILKRCLAGMFNFPPGELTTAEFCEAALQNPAAGPDLAAEAVEFLRTCDRQKFAPAQPVPSGGAVDHALTIIDHAEKRQLAAAQLDAQPRPAQVNGQAENQNHGA